MKVKFSMEQDHREFAKQEGPVFEFEVPEEYNKRADYILSFLESMEKNNDELEKFCRFIQEAREFGIRGRRGVVLEFRGDKTNNSFLFYSEPVNAFYRIINLPRVNEKSNAQDKIKEIIRLYKNRHDEDFILFCKIFIGSEVNPLGEFSRYLEKFRHDKEGSLGKQKFDKWLDMCENIRTKVKEMDSDCSLQDCLDKLEEIKNLIKEAIDGNNSIFKKRRHERFDAFFGKGITNSEEKLMKVLQLVEKKILEGKDRQGTNEEANKGRTESYRH